MFKRLSVLLLLAAALNGCGGGGKGVTDKLVTLRPGVKWVYKFSGTVTLPSGGGSQTARDGSTFTMVVQPFTAKDASNNDVNVLDRTFDVTLQDNTERKGDFRLYFTQNSTGIFVHGINLSTGDTVDPANDKFRPATATPPSQFIYMPDPAANDSAITDNDPLDTAGTGSLELQIGHGRRIVTVPAGSFLSKPMALTENFSDFKLTNIDFVPDVGIIDGVVDATMSDGTRLQGTLILTSVNL